jgi:hypothetical protein
MITLAINKFSAINRKRKLKRVTAYIKTHKIKSVLLVGCIAEPNNPNFENLIENGLIKLGLEVTVSGLEESSSTWPNWITANGLDLPFQNNSFDLVFSNAVIEHVGHEVQQRQFVKEHERVGKHWIFTTPNRLFPIESHSNTLFLHMSKNWEHHLFSRLLSKKDIREICPDGVKVIGHLFAPTFIAIGINCER